MSKTEKQTGGKVTFNPAVLKAILPFISTEETRYYLNGVYLTGGLFVATDGHKLAVIKPEIFLGTLAEPFILPVDAIKKILAAKPEFKKMPLWVTLDTAEKRATIHHGAETHSESEKYFEILSFKYEPIDGTFPDWKRVIPDESHFDKPAQPAFNATYLSLFQSLGKQLKIRLNNDTGSPSIIQSRTDDWEAFGVIMPMCDDTPKAFPKWVKN